MKIAEEQIQKIRGYRVHLHRHPELSWEEFETAEFVRSVLRELPGMELVENPLKTAVIARIKGACAGVNVALRGDMDALRVEEKWQSDCMSEKEGISHACGHDFHTASLLGAAMILSEHRAELQGDVIFIFQPAEETTDGAKKLIETGFLKELKPHVIFGLHNRPEVPTGKVVVNEGPMMTAKKNFRITVLGRGGHGSMPELCIDPIVCASAMVQNIQTIVSRNIAPMDAMVLSICSIHGGSVENLIVDDVTMTGSLRCFDQKVQKRGMERLQEIVEQTAATYECQVKFEVLEEVPAVWNHGKMYEIARAATAEAVGEEAITTAQPSMASEDFAHFMQEIPGFFYWIGNRKEGDPCYAWHNDQFHVDDDALEYAVKTLAQSVFTAQKLWK